MRSPHSGRAKKASPARLSPAILLLASAALAAPDAPPAVEANLTPSETLAQAKEYVSKMQDSLRSIVQLQEVAKKRKDIIRLNCVNDKLLQTKGLLTLSDGAMGNLNEAVAKNDENGRAHEYTRLTILYQKVLVLATEAGNCVGEDLSYVGTQTNSWEVDPAIPQRDVTAFDTPGVDPSRPPSASLP
jgi:hypothetical protein